MSIQRHSATTIKASGLHYISLPAEIMEALGVTAGLEAVGLWALMNSNKESYKIIKSVVCKKYKCSERSFTRCMQAMEKLELAWIEAAPRSKSGTFAGKTWCVSNLPKTVQESLDLAVEAMKRMAQTPEEPRVSTDPAVLRGSATDPAVLPTSAENRPSVNGGDITKDELLTKYETDIYINNAHTHEPKSHHPAPQRRDPTEALWERDARLRNEQAIATGKVEVAERKTEEGNLVIKLQIPDDWYPAESTVALLAQQFAHQGFDLDDLNGYRFSFINSRNMSGNIKSDPLLWENDFRKYCTAAWQNNGRASKVKLQREQLYLNNAQTGQGGYKTAQEKRAQRDDDTMAHLARLVGEI